MASTVEGLRKILKETQPPKILWTPEILEIGGRFQANGLVDDNVRRMQKKLDELMEVDADEVFPGIYIGNKKAAQDIDFLKNLGIGSVLNCAQGTGFDQINTNEDFYRDTNIKYMGLDILDMKGTDIFQYLDGAFEFIDEALKQSGKILVHCNMGASRAPSVTTAYLICRQNLTAAQALKTLRERRDILPNEGFLQQLCDMENKSRKH